MFLLKVSYKSKAVLVSPSVVIKTMCIDDMQFSVIIQKIFLSRGRYKIFKERTMRQSLIKKHKVTKIRMLCREETIYKPLGTHV